MSLEQKDKQEISLNRALWMFMWRVFLYASPYVALLVFAIVKISGTNINPYMCCGIIILLQFGMWPVVWQCCNWSRRQLRKKGIQFP